MLSATPAPSLFSLRDPFNDLSEHALPAVVLPHLPSVIPACRREHDPDDEGREHAERFADSPAGVSTECGTDEGQQACHAKLTMCPAAA